MKKNVRKQGILLPISSIPSAYGIGTFGKESYRFVDFLEKSGNHLWQILPLGPYRLRRFSVPVLFPPLRGTPTILTWSF